MDGAPKKNYNQDIDPAATETKSSYLLASHFLAIRFLRSCGSGGAPGCTAHLYSGIGWMCISPIASTYAWCSSAKGKWLTSQPKGFSSSMAMRFNPQKPMSEKNVNADVRTSPPVKTKATAGQSSTKMTRHQPIIYAKQKGNGTRAIRYAELKPSRPLPS